MHAHFRAAAVNLMTSKEVGDRVAATWSRIRLRHCSLIFWSIAVLAVVVNLIKDDAMARASKIKDKGAILPAQGKKISFGDDVDDGYPDFEAPAPISKPAKSKRTRDQTPSDFSDNGSDDDEAPEAVGMKAGRKIDAEISQKAERWVEALIIVRV